MWRRIALPGATVPWAARPAVRAGVVAVGCSEDVPSGPVPVIAVHALDGAPRFVVTHGATGAWAVETSEPTIDDAGVIRAVVYEHEVELAVVAARTNGAILPRTVLAPPPGGDSGPKLGTCIEPCTDGFIVSWEYRQDRAYFAARYRDGAREPEWTASEWIVGATSDTVIGYTTPVRRANTTPFDPLDSELVCRAKRDGRVLWRRDGRFIDVGGTTTDAVLLVDRSARHAEMRALAMAGRAEWPRQPTSLELVDAWTEKPRWTLDVPDDVFATYVEHDRATVLSTEPGGAVRMTADDRTTVLPVRRTSVRAGGPSSSTAFPPEQHLTPVLVGHAMWADDQDLHAGTALALPAAIAGFRRRIRDRSLTKADAVLAGDTVYLRSEDALWIYVVDAASTAMPIAW